MLTYFNLDDFKFIIYALVVCISLVPSKFHFVALAR